MSAYFSAPDFSRIFSAAKMQSADADFWAEPTTSRPEMTAAAQLDRDFCDSQISSNVFTAKHSLSHRRIASMKLVYAAPTA